LHHFLFTDCPWCAGAAQIAVLAPQYNLLVLGAVCRRAGAMLRASAGSPSNHRAGMSCSISKVSCWQGERCIQPHATSSGTGCSACIARHVISVTLNVWDATGELYMLGRHAD